MLKYRILTICFLLPCVLWLILYAPIGVKRFAIGLLMVIAFLEWRGLSAPYSKVQHILAIGALLGLFILSHKLMLATQILWAVSSLFWLLLAPLWLKKHWQWPPVSRLLLGSFLIAALFSSMAYLVHVNPTLFLYGMSLIWVSDSFAYITGRLLGRHKLAPSISPGKTWEGAVGGVVASMAYAAFVIPKVLGLFFSWPMALIVLVLTAYGIIGDLWESLLKRQAGKKDSGTLLPGHGGILDRVDALFPVLPMIALLYMLRG